MIISFGLVVVLIFYDINNGVLDGDDSNILMFDGNYVFFYVMVDLYIVIGWEGIGIIVNVSGQVVFVFYLDVVVDNKLVMMWLVLFELVQYFMGNFDEVVDFGQSLKIGVIGDFNVNFGMFQVG